MGWAKLSATHGVYRCRRGVGIFRAYDRVAFRTIVSVVRQAKKLLSRLAPFTLKRITMDTNTLLIILLVIFLCGGFGYYGRGRWF